LEELECGKINKRTRERTRERTRVRLNVLQFRGEKKINATDARNERM